MKLGDKIQGRGPWCQTFTGRAFYPCEPYATDVDERDIAHSLALQSRFGGHCLVPYSVAEHCLRVSRIVPPEHALAGLLHDAAEAYVVDLPRPLKVALAASDYSALEKKCARVIGYRFGVDLVNLPDEVRHADEVMLATERRDLMTACKFEWQPLPDALLEAIEPMAWDEAEELFLGRLRELTRTDTDRCPPLSPDEALGAAREGE